MDSKCGRCVIGLENSWYRVLVWRWVIILLQFELLVAEPLADAEAGGSATLSAGQCVADLLVVLSHDFGEPLRLAVAEGVL